MKEKEREKNERVCDGRRSESRSASLVVVSRCLKSWKELPLTSVCFSSRQRNAASRD